MQAKGHHIKLERRVWRRVLQSPLHIKGTDVPPIFSRQSFILGIGEASNSRIRPEASTHQQRAILCEDANRRAAPLGAGRLHYSQFQHFLHLLLQPLHQLL